MITKIKHVRDFRSFNGWVWPHDLPLFRHVNLVYGINGTGKSTLASLLQQAALDQDWSSGLEIDVTAASGSSRVVSTASDPLWRDVRVFNRKYVEANLQFEEQAGSTAAPLLVLGEQRVEAEIERTRIDKRLADIAEQLPVLKKEQKSIRTQLETLATDRARLIVQEIGAVGGRYAPRSYNATKVRQSVKSGIEASSTQADITKELSLARSSSKPEIGALIATQFSFAEIARQAQEAIRESAVSNALADLQDPAHSRWAQDGVELHKDRDTCIFCASDISPERRQALAEHFDTSLLRLQNKIASLQRELDQKGLAAKQAVAALPRSGDLFEMHKEGYEGAVEQIRAVLKRYLASVDALAAVLEKKHESLLTSSSDVISLDVTDLSLADVSLIITQHNATASDFEKQRVAA
ncbi:MAG TPA: AAA family ATPase, partial [Solirubrobacteraceae bacterium]|nr:AAA family ATPase [Solirubrobacteraceae bacterium]